MTLEYHPMASTAPLMEGEAFDRLVASIKSCGLIHPIIVCQGMVLDGRNRLRACITAGVEPDFVEFTESDPAEIAAFVEAMNGCRFHAQAEPAAKAPARCHRHFRRGATRKDPVVVRFVAEFRREHGRNPSLPEMRQAFPVLSKTSAQRYRTCYGDTARVEARKGGTRLATTAGARWH